MDLEDDAEGADPEVDDEEEGSDDVYVCDQCSKELHNAKDFINHMKEHADHPEVEDKAEVEEAEEEAEPEEDSDDIE